MLASFFILVVLLHYSTVISKLSEQNTVLAQRLAILENRLGRAGNQDRLRRGPASGRAYNCQVPEENLTAQEAEFEAILVRLRDEVDQRGRRPGRRGWRRPVRAPAAGGRGGSGRSAPSGHFSHDPGARGDCAGSLLTPAKSVLRKLMRWYVEPLAVDQRRFNAPH